MTRADIEQTLHELAVVTQYLHGTARAMRSLTEVLDLIDNQLRETRRWTELAIAKQLHGEDLAADILKDPDFKAEMKALIRIAFERALKDLAAPVDEETD